MNFIKIRTTWNKRVMVYNVLHQQLSPKIIKWIDISGWSGLYILYWSWIIRTWKSRVYVSSLLSMQYLRFRFIFNTTSTSKNKFSYDTVFRRRHILSEFRLKIWSGSDKKYNQNWTWSRIRSLFDLNGIKQQDGIYFTLL